jgi:DNA-binding transcriptional MerR regulator
MSAYTTGEIAKLCNVSVRTVQFYDAKDLLKPTELSEGGRRLYSESGMKRMRMICMLKSLGLSLESIKGILDSDHPETVLLMLLDEQQRQIDEEIGLMQQQKNAIDGVRETLQAGRTFSVESIADMEHMMEEKRKLRKLHGKIFLLAIPMTLIEWGTILHWIFTGIWWPFVACVPLIVLFGIIITRMYFGNTLYICPECGERFRPALKEAFWAGHTPKTRKLTCACCGKKSWCVETYGHIEDERK